MIRLSFSEIVSQSFRFFFANLPLFFHLVTVPWVLSVAIRVVGALAMSDDDIVHGALIEKLLDVIPTTMFLVAWLRFTLLGANRIDGTPGLGWSRREVLLGTSAVPMLALMVGIGISMAIDVLATRAGLGGWTGVVAVSSSGALGALAVLIVSGHLPWHEVRALLFVRGARGTNA